MIRYSIQHKSSTREPRLVRQTGLELTWYGIDIGNERSKSTRRCVTIYDGLEIYDEGDYKKLGEG